MKFYWIGPCILCAGSTVAEHYTHYPKMTVRIPHWHREKENSGKHMPVSYSKVQVFVLYWSVLMVFLKFQHSTIRYHSPTIFFFILDAAYFPKNWQFLENMTTSKKIITLVEWYRVVLYWNWRNHFHLRN